MIWLIGLITGLICIVVGVVFFAPKKLSKSIKKSEIPQAELKPQKPVDKDSEEEIIRGMRKPPVLSLTPGLVEAPEETVGWAKEHSDVPTESAEKPGSEDTETEGESKEAEASEESEAETAETESPEEVESAENPEEIEASDEKENEAETENSEEVEEKSELSEKEEKSEEAEKPEAEEKEDDEDNDKEEGDEEEGEEDEEEGEEDEEEDEEPEEPEESEEKEEFEEKSEKSEKKEVEIESDKNEKHEAFEHEKLTDEEILKKEEGGHYLDIEKHESSHTDVPHPYLKKPKEPQKDDIPEAEETEEKFEDNDEPH